MTISSKNRCPECQENFHGRSDKKFCSDACRNAYHNRLNRENNNLIRNVHNRLRKNYRILRQLPTERIGTPIPRSYLTNKGFDFSAITRLKLNENGKHQFMIYDMRFTPLDEIRILVCPENRVNESE